MRIICAWCRKVMTEGQPGDPVSHGICELCAASELAALRFVLAREA